MRRFIKKSGDVTEERRLQLESELEMQKNRFLIASRHGMEALKTDLSLMNWLRTYPRESAVLILMSGFVAARYIQARRHAAEAARDSAPLSAEDQQYSMKKASASVSS